MRLKFWDKFNKRWINTASLELSTLGEIIGVRDCDGNLLGPNQFETVRSTGLKDKNGKEIYEGNIVTTGTGEGGFPPYDQEQPRLVEFRNGCWCFDAGRYEDGDWIRFGFWIASNEGKNQLKQMEVIGSIQENPELIKEVKSGKS